jgi:hypothetical protein
VKSFVVHNFSETIEQSTTSLRIGYLVRKNKLGRNCGVLEKIDAEIKARGVVNELIECGQGILLRVHLPTVFLQLFLERSPIRSEIAREKFDNILNVSSAVFWKADTPVFIVITIISTFEIPFPNKFGDTVAVEEGTRLTRPRYNRAIDESIERLGMTRAGGRNSISSGRGH